MTIQEKRMPALQPMAVHSSMKPEAKAAPGRPMSSQALSPLARSLKAMTHGPSLRSPRMKPAWVVVRR